MSPPSHPPQRFVWRSVLTIFGPLMILGFYLAICVYFLARPPVNNIVLSTIDGNWIFYAWFILSILILDWARTGLANIEASALMKPHMAPRTAMQLMWHTDGKWANPLWWVKAGRIFASRLFRLRNDSTSPTECTPGKLWFLLSLAMLFLFAAVPLSGLSIQTTQVQTKTSSLVPIYGPSAKDFGVANEPFDLFGQTFRRAWQLGQPLLARRGGLVYAPTSVSDVSTTYFDDLASTYAKSIEVFTGPAVRELAAGVVWGLWANISCNPVPSNRMQMIRSSSHREYSIYSCATNSTESCDFIWRNSSDSLQPSEAQPICLPEWHTETISRNKTFINPLDQLDYSLIVAADGFSGDFGPLNNGRRNYSPYFLDQNHDNCTFDHFRGASAKDVTTASMEFFIWQSRPATDPTMQNFIQTPSDLVQVEHANTGDPWVGFGVHCDVASAVGSATVDPALRQFSGFKRAAAESWLTLPNASSVGPYMLPLQLQALLNMMPPISPDMLNSSNPGTKNSWSPESIWTSIQLSVNSQESGILVNRTASMDPNGGNSSANELVYPLLTPRDVQKSMYKLLGQNVLMLMDQKFNQDDTTGWFGELYGLKQVTYITTGVLPWQYPLVLLAIWALLTSGAALWMLVSAGPRWAPVLDGYEMFKLGARFVQNGESIESLNESPGMIGIVLGRNKSEADRHSDDRQSYHFGLSSVPFSTEFGPGIIEPRRDVIA